MILIAPGALRERVNIMSNRSSPPSSTQILVIGGGPAGSYAATALVREGFEVHLLEKDPFPRYHIGESLLPSWSSFLSFIGAAEKVANFGFTPKVGAALKLNQEKREGYLGFGQVTAWNVIRSEFDDLLLKHASLCAVVVHEGFSVQQILFSADHPSQPIAAEWKTRDGSTGRINFDWLVDASGRNGIMSTKYLHNRKFNSILRNRAVWGYWKGARVYAKGTDHENAPWFEALTDESGWAWFIPLHNGTVSVGIVISEESHLKKKAAMPSSDEGSGETYYLSQLKLTPGLVDLLGEAKFLGELKMASDYSYSALQYGGNNYRIVGDAGAFIDPLFSSGVHLAFSSALSAAATIAASIRGHCTEAEAITFHDLKTSTSYTRFMLAVLGVYKQIKAQESNVLSDVGEDNFDRAFEFLRPVVLGGADTDSSVTEDMVQTTIDFFSHVLGTTNPDMHESVAQRVNTSLMAPDGPIMGKEAVAAVAGVDKEAKEVLWQINSKRGLDVLYDWEKDFRKEKLGGFCVVLERGGLGLQRETDL
ncbi:putative halogenase [Favolaschia claudopus]|uniref:Halogenase n=1 Tax=Favolaschia claudopus TaxID=2862362 RepID=A0AAW0D509_9AGAR